jgi:xanthosine utilization system XapX-like protein
MRQKITPWLCAVLEFGGVCFALWLWYYSALAANNYARVEGFPLPPLVQWFVWASRYRITVVVGCVFAGVEVMKVIRDTPAWRHAVAFLLLGLLVGSTIIFTAFTMCVGSCLCDAWRQWEHKGHPTKTSTVPLEAAPSASPSVP